MIITYKDKCRESRPTVAGAFPSSIRKSLSLPGHKRSSSLVHPDKIKRPSEESLFILSGCRESNPALVFPKHVYYRYTTPRYNLFILAYLRIITIT